MGEPETSWPEVLSTLLAGSALSTASAAWAMDQIMDDAATPAQIAAFVTALRAKGETAAEVEGLVQTMLAHAAPFPLDPALRSRAVDTCGTGGDRAHTVNLSTMAALVVAGAGLPVVKHGNRAASSRSGSADVLEALGVVIDLSPSRAAACFASSGLVFCMAPVFHPALRYATPVRRELGVPTVFNILGPLTNPAQPGAQAVGVADLRLAPVVAQVLADRGASALVFHGDDGLDELTPSTTSRIWAVADGVVRADVLDPAVLGFPPSSRSDLRGADAAYNALVVRRVLDGERGPIRDAVLLAAAAALVAADGVSSAPVVDQIGATLPRAADAIDSGAAAAALTRWISASRAAAS